MRSRLLILALVTLAAGPPVAAQDGNPYPFLSTSADEPKTGKPQKQVPALLLRPNNELSYFAYVRNPGDQKWKNLAVVLAADEKGERVLAEGTVASLDAEETVAVRLAAKVPAADKPPADKPAPPATLTLPETAYLLLVRTGEDGVKSLLPSTSGKPPVSIRVRSPKEYLSIAQSVPPGSQNTLQVQIADKGGKTDPFRGKPCKVKLDVRPELSPGLDPASTGEGSYEAVVAPGSDKITLVAKNLKFAAGKAGGVFSVTADGYPGAFLFKVDFSGNSPAPVDGATHLAIGLPKYAIPGKPLTAKVEVFGDEAAGLPKLKFYRAEVGEPEIVTGDLKTPRDQKLSLRTGAEGELIVASEVKDWVVPLETAGLYGTRSLLLGLENATNRNVVPGEATIVFDETKPENVKFVKPPATIEKGKKLVLTASGEDRESGIKSVLFYLGDPPVDGKKAPRGTTVAGVEGKTKGTWTGTFELPPALLGKVEVGVRFANPLGMVADETFELFIAEPKVEEPKPKPTTGKITGKVIQGSQDRAQPGLQVELRDADGKKIDTASTDKDGVFKFVDLKPGKYSVASVKPIDYGAKGDAKVTVVAGETAKPEISIKR